MSITNRFTFLFFFNLINLGIESWEKMILFSNYKKDVGNKTEFIEEINRIFKKLTKNSEFVMSLIKKDKELNNLFRSMLDEINHKLKDVKAINKLKKELV